MFFAKSVIQYKCFIYNSLVVKQFLSLVASLLRRTFLWRLSKLPATIDKAHNYMQVEIDNDKQSDIKEPWAFLVPLSPLRDVLGHLMLMLTKLQYLKDFNKVRSLREAGEGPLKL